MKRNGAAMVRGPGGAMTRPLLWSTAGHLLVLSACLLLGVGRGPADRLLPAVEVLIVGAEPGPAGDESSGPAPAALPRGVRGLPPSSRGEDLPASRDEEPPSTAAPPTLGPAGMAAPERGIADPAARPTGPTAFLPATGLPAGPAAFGPAAAAAPVFPSSHPFATGSFAGPAAGGAPSAAAAVPGGGGAGPGWTGTEGDRSRPGGEIGLLRERIQSRIVYPDEAVRRGLEGEVLLRIHIEPGGVPNEIRVARSSGARLLDDAARRGVVRAAPLPSSPGWVEVPVLFRLQ